MEDKTPQKKLGDRIKQKRMEKELSQKELGEAVNYSYGAISHFECGSREPKATALFSLADALDCPVEDLNPFG